MNKIKLNNSDDLFKIMLKVQDKDGNIKISKIQNFVGAENLSKCNQFIRELQEKKLLEITDLNGLHLCRNQRMQCLIVVKKVWSKIYPLFIAIISYIFGIFSDEIKGLIKTLLGK